jgi:hypothetical protein
MWSGPWDGVTLPVRILMVFYNPYLTTTVDPWTGQRCPTISKARRSDHRGDEPNFQRIQEKIAILRQSFYSEHSTLIAPSSLRCTTVWRRIQYLWARKRSFIQAESSSFKIWPFSHHCRAWSLPATSDCWHKEGREHVTYRKLIASWDLCGVFSALTWARTFEGPLRIEFELTGDIEC